MSADPAPMPHPGVRFPPPFLFAAAFLAAWWLGRRLPLALLPPGARLAGEIPGLVLGVAGLVLIFWGLATFRRHRTAIFPNRPASHIVRSGPYRFTRNPMYTGMTMCYCGLTLLLNDLWPLILLPIALALLVRLVIAREERYLASAFPAEYDAYRLKVRRWL
jgi:protein-S-isoprenylcysteine O-methyltransferase Ste14